MTIKKNKSSTPVTNTPMKARLISDIAPNSARESECVQRIREILSSSRNQALQTVNFAMVKAYWEIGQEIVEEEQRGADRASYGEQLLVELSRQLVREYGKGFRPRNLLYIRNFFLAFPKSN